jgi:transposase InsO family protein
VRYANQLPEQVEQMIVRLKKEKPHWGARKIRELLVRRLAGEVRIPARSTVHAVLDRHGLVKRGRQRRRNKAEGTALRQALAPNQLWCADFKGEFKLGNRQYCYPLTVTDQVSRFVLLCEALESTKEAATFTAFQRLFEERGLPEAIRTDNGLPFASPNGLYNLSKETTRPAQMNSLRQQARFDDFISEFNTERPHEALNMKCPQEVYAPSRRIYKGLPEVEYPFHDKDILVTACGRICMHRKKINISTVMAGQRLGIKEVDDGIWLVSFMHHDLGYIDLEQKSLQTIDNPFGTRVSPMS